MNKSFSLRPLNIRMNKVYLTSHDIFFEHTKLDLLRFRIRSRLTSNLARKVFNRRPRLFLSRKRCSSFRTIRNSSRYFPAPSFFVVLSNVTFDWYFALRGPVCFGPNKPTGYTKVVDLRLLARR
ncbi:hypothetical protein RvY_10867-3 [Ramazzottius varieornatus]|nr:hypothetical protein RvY_10867-3 [Ramazzottius varieornatus]